MHLSCIKHKFVCICLFAVKTPNLCDFSNDFPNEFSSLGEEHNTFQLDEELDLESSLTVQKEHLSAIKRCCI